jgi:Trk K+ transport system NAD-binding subunit
MPPHFAAIDDRTGKVKNECTVTDVLAHDPAILIVGDDLLAERVCDELAAAGGTRVRVVAPKIADDDEELLEAGVSSAVAILTLSSDDERNLSIALRARMLNPHIRVVLRQFGTKIGRKIEQNLPDSTVLSPAAHSAATYAGAALDPGCFFALRFPDLVAGAFVGFTFGFAGELDVAHLTVAEAEQKLGLRIVALGIQREPVPDSLIDANNTIVAFGRVIERRSEARRERETPTARPYVRRTLAESAIESLARTNPILRTIAVSAIVFYAVAAVFFHFALHLSWPGSAFDVVQAMTSTGFGDTSVVRRGTAIVLGAIVVMIGGTIFTSIFIGYVSAAITRAQWTAQQGLRRIRGHGHYVVCGGGRIGGAVVNFLIEAGKHVVVIDSHPDPTLVRRARESRLDLLTGDATNEDVLALCDVAHAAAVVVLTNSDPGNLEIALGARAMRADVPLVVRMEDRTFAQATASLFGIATFSPAALTAPAFAGLARFPGTLGRVRIAGKEHTIVQLWGGGGAQAPEGAVPLCAWRTGRGIVLIHSIEEIVAGDTVIYAIPIGRPSPEPGIVSA